MYKFFRKVESQSINISMEDFIKKTLPNQKADKAFQANEFTRWTEEMASSFMTSIITNKAPSKYIFCDVQKCYDSAVEEERYDDIVYFKKWLDLGVKFLNLDSNNRCINLISFINNKIGIQEGTRRLRYEWFFNLKALYGFDFIVTAHQLNDQIETYLINSMRGTGLTGLLGIPEKTDKLFRPLLDITKNEISKYAINHNILFREDSSNFRNDYLRNTIRNSVIPKLQEFDDNVMLKFKTTFNNLISTKIFVDKIIKDIKAKIFLKEDFNERVKISDLTKLDPLGFYIHSLFSDYGFDYKEVVKLFTSDSGKYIKSIKYKLTKNKNDLIISKND